MSFIGRAEPEVEHILKKLFDTRIVSQLPLKSLIPKSVFDSLDEEIQKHKFDLYLYDQHMVVEVNYKHKEKAARKWRTIFEPLLRKYNIKTLTIHDYECESLFEPADYSKHVLSWDDIIDVINALKTQNISL